MVSKAVYEAGNRSGGFSPTNFPNPASPVFNLAFFFVTVVTTHVWETFGGTHIPDECEHRADYKNYCNIENRLEYTPRDKFSSI